MEKLRKNWGKLKVCTFNINSIRARKDLIIQWLSGRSFDIDVLCFQEIKVQNENFPSKDFYELGYKYQIIHGQKGFNGVALLSRYPLSEIQKGLNVDYLDYQSRIIVAKIDSVFIINVYAPHGGLRGSEKYYYKLSWYKNFIKFLEESFCPKTDKVIIVGDLNIAYEDIDVFNPRLLNDTVGTMPEERQILKKIFDLGYIDVFRYLYPDKKQFTWWDYIGGAVWRDEGMRIDYVLFSQSLIPSLIDVEVDMFPRKRRQPKPSDHAPVIVNFIM